MLLLIVIFCGLWGCCNLQMTSEVAYDQFELNDLNKLCSHGFLASKYCHWMNLPRSNMTHWPAWLEKSYSWDFKQGCKEEKGNTTTGSSNRTRPQERRLLFTTVMKNALHFPQLESLKVGIGPPRIRLRTYFCEIWLAAKLDSKPRRRKSRILVYHKNFWSCNTTGPPEGGKRAKVGRLFRSVTNPILCNAGQQMAEWWAIYV